MSGNISKTGFEKIDNIEYFVKAVPVEDFKLSTLNFQMMLSQILNGKFKVNRFEKQDTVSENYKMYYKIYFEKINEKEYVLSEDNVKMFGKVMAIIHNYSYRNRDNIKLDEIDKKYGDLTDWKMLKQRNNIAIDKLDGYNTRKDLLKEIQPFNTEQPKIPLHRDFRLHNILFDGEAYHLIDFDFAAINYVSIEVMSFVSDLIVYGANFAKLFLEEYLKQIEFKVYKHTFVDDYLNYLCSNTFPYYLYGQIPEQNFNNLVNDRNETLSRIVANKKIINNILNSIEYDYN